MTFAIDSSIQFYLIPILNHILQFWDNSGQIWSKITKPRGQNEYSTFSGENILL